MNTTKLHILAATLVAELKRTESVSILKQASEALKKQVAQPQDPTPQEQLTSHLTNLYNRLEGSPVDDFSPAWRDAMEEITVAGEFGSNLATRVRKIFERNKITQQTALKELQQLHKRLENTQNHLQGIVNAFEYLDVGEDTLEENECEIGIVIPRSLVDDNLKNFGAELVEWEKLLLVFSELATGEREPLQIRQISSSELSVFLEYAPEIGACIAIAVERIVALYKQVLEIKKLRTELAEREVPEEALTGIAEHAASIVKPKLEELANDLMEKYVSELERGRRNELSTELRQSLYKLANRIDRGANVELRVAPPTKEEPEEEEEGEPGADPQADAIHQIRESAANIEYLRVDGEPVLFLPEGNDDDRG